MRVIDIVKLVVGIGLFIWAVPYILVGMVVASFWVDALVAALMGGNF